MRLSGHNPSHRDGLTDFSYSVIIQPYLQALVYDILPWRKVPESDARSGHPANSKGRTRAGHASSVHKLKLLFTVSLPRVTLRCLRFGENEVKRTRKVLKINKKMTDSWQKAKQSVKSSINSNTLKTLEGLNLVALLLPSCLEI